MKCPNCNSSVRDDEINHQADTVVCSSCEHSFIFSKQIEEDEDRKFDLSALPKGVWIKREMDKLIIGVSAKSPAAFFVIPFMIVWTGLSMGGIYGSQFAQKEFDPGMSLFGIPFFLVSLFFWGLGLHMIWGKCEVTLTRDGGRIFTGIGNIGSSQSFVWDDIDKVVLVQSQQGNRNRNGKFGYLTLEGRKSINFASGIGKERKYIFYRALRVSIKKFKNRLV